MIGHDMVNRLYNSQVIDPEGEKIGSVKQVWLDSRTGDPVWASVHTGLFGTKETFVPLQRAELRNDQVQVPVGKAQVKDAPRADAVGDQMSDDTQQELFQYYGMGAGGQLGTGQQSRPGGQRGANQRSSTSGELSADQQATARGASQHTDTGQVPSNEGLTRSEEQLRVDTERVETGRARLVKHVVTEEQQISVPVSHEEVRVEREPVSDAGKDTPTISDGEQEVRLHADKPVVHKETVPKERVRLTKDTVADEETVTGEVRKEQIDVENDRAGRHGENDRAGRHGRKQR